MEYMRYITILRHIEEEISHAARPRPSRDGRYPNIGLQSPHFINVRLRKIQSFSFRISVPSRMYYDWKNP